MLLSKSFFCSPVCFSVFLCMYSIPASKHMQQFLSIHICLMHKFAHIWTPAVVLNCIGRASVCNSVCVCVCMQAQCCTEVAETDGSAALHTHVSAPLMPACCVVRRVCVLLQVCSSLRVCRSSVLLSTATGIGAAAPDGTRERSASRQRALDTPDNTQEKKRLFVFYGVF